MTGHEWTVLSVIAIPIAFFIGKYSNRITIFHARSEETLSVSEFMRSKQPE